MSRDSVKYRYVQVGVPRLGVLERLEQEANTRGVPFATHLTDLLVDRDAFVYGDGSNGIWIPRGGQIITSVTPLASTSAGEVQGINEGSLEENLDAFCEFLEDDDSPTETDMRAVR